MINNKGAFSENKVLLALGTSSGEKINNLKDARFFLSTLSAQPILTSSFWETEPVGPAQNLFINAVIAIRTRLNPTELLERIKLYEASRGRDLSAPRWTDRIIDIDIIDFNNQCIINADLEIPHPEYRNRLFVLMPLKEISPEWTDCITGCHIDELIFKAPPLQLSKMSLKW